MTRATAKQLRTIERDRRRVERALQVAARKRLLDMRAESAALRKRLRERLRAERGMTMEQILQNGPTPRSG